MHKLNIEKIIYYHKHIFDYTFDMKNTHMLSLEVSTTFLIVFVCT